MQRDGVIVNRLRFATRAACGLRSLALLLSSCADGPSDDGLDAGVPEPRAQQAAPPNSGDQPTFTAIRADGSGCKPGTWSSRFDDTNKSFSVNFFDYILYMDESVRLKSLNCAISVTIESPKGLSYAVTRLQYQMESQMPPGMIARQGIVYAFEGTGTAAPITDLRTFTGPLTQGIGIVDNVEFSRGILTWSDCDVRSDLQIRTTISLQNATPPDVGFFSMNFVDGSTTLRDGGLTAGSTAGSIRVDLATRPCPGSP
jgi:hypothetical protein